jgi:hypothetical protein
MDVLLVFESMYGNTARVAESIAEGMEHADVRLTLRNVDDAGDVDVSAFDMLIVGGPTHAHGMTRSATRRTAIDDEKNTYDDPSVGAGLRDWLGGLPAVVGLPAATFDTRFDRSPLLTGEASKGIERRLRGLRFDVRERKSFFVDTSNQLVDGQLKRAWAWGRSLASMFVPVV